MTIKELPKVDIHRHLEGSLRLSSLAEIARAEGLPLPSEAEALRSYVQIVGEQSVNTAEFLDKFSIIRTFFRSREVIERFVNEVVEDASQDNVRVLELRFTPAALANAGQFELEDVVEWVVSAAQSAGTRYDVEVASVLGVNRHESVEIADKVTDLAIAFQSAGITGLDLAGDEASFPAGPFTDTLRRGKEAGLGLTIHAGEWAGAENVREAIEAIQADRIGHGIHVLEDEDITALAARSKVIFEVSITSNWKTGAVKDLSSHPLTGMIQAGLSVALTTDDPSIFDTTLTDEFEIAQTHFDFSMDSIKGFNLTALQAMFISDREKKRIEKELISAYWGAEGDLASHR